MSPAQNAMLEIKLAAIQNLQYHDYLYLLGEKAEGQGSISRYNTIILAISLITHYNLSLCFQIGALPTNQALSPKICTSISE